MEKTKAMSRRRFLANTGLAGAAAAAVAACGSSSGSAASSGYSGTYKVPPELVTAAKKYQGTTLTMLSQSQYAKSANTALNQALQAFAQQTGTTINNSLINGDAGTAIATADASVKAGKPADLAFYTDSRFIEAFNTLGDLIPVSDVVQELESQYGPPAAEAKLNSYVNGQWWGIPFYTIGIGTFVRKDWLAAKGINPQEIKTFTNARDIMLEVSDPSKQRYGWGMTPNRSGDGNGWIETCINGYGGAVTNNDGTKVIFNSPATIEAVTFIADLFTNPKYAPMMPPGIQAWTDSSNNENWLAGVIGMTLNQFSVYAQAKLTNSPFFPDTLALAGLAGPAEPTPRPLAFGQTQDFVIFKGAKNVELAKIVAKFLVSGNALLNMAKSAIGLVLPAYEKTWTSDPFYLNGDPALKMLNGVMTQKLPVTTSTGITFPQVPSAGHQSVLQSYVLTDMMSEILQKKASVKVAVRDAHARMVSIFDTMGIKQ